MDGIPENAPAAALDEEDGGCSYGTAEVAVVNAAEAGSVCALPRMAVVLGGGTRYSGISWAIRWESCIATSSGETPSSILGDIALSLPKGGGAGGVRRP